MPDASIPFDDVQVLVVEDEYLVAVYLEDVLDDIGCRCCGVAGTAEEALAVAESERPTIALVDIGLRGGDDGISLACKLRDRFGIAVIFMSGASDPETRQRAEVARPRGFLSKPCTEDELASALRSALAPPPPV